MQRSVDVQTLANGRAGENLTTRHGVQQKGGSSSAKNVLEGSTHMFFQLNVIFYVHQMCFTSHLHFYRKLKQFFFLFWGRGVNFLMQLQFLAPVELFFLSS